MNKIECKLNKHVYLNFPAIDDNKREIIVVEASCCYVTFNPSHLHFKILCIIQLKGT